MVFGGLGVPVEAEDAGFQVRNCILVIGVRTQWVWLIRKPLEAHNVVTQVLETGTGALWIDGCRIGAEKRTYKGSGAQPTKLLNHAQGDTGIGLMDGRGRDLEFTVTGRWPPNLVLLHTPGCHFEGTKRAPATGIHGTTTAVRRSGVHAEAGGHQTIGRVQPVMGYAEADGTENIPAWACSPECVVQALDLQSGKRKSSFVAAYHQNNRHGEFLNKLGHPGDQGYDDFGGASRFYPQFGSEAELDAWLLRLILGPA